MQRLLVFFFAVGLLACGESGPKNGKYWAQKLIKDPGQRQEALRELKRLKDPTALPGLLEFLKQDTRYKADAVQIINDLNDKSAVPGLIAAINYEVINQDNLDAKAKNRANGLIATGLGKLGDPAAIEPLKKLLASNQKDVQVPAIRALERLNAADAATALIEIAGNPERPDSTKAALVALGSLGKAEAIPTLIKMLFVEKDKASFYKEASFALFQLGREAVQPLLDTYEGKNAEVQALQLDPAVVPAKVAIILGELGDARAIPALRKMAVFADDASPMNMAPLVRANAMRALAFLNDRESVPLVRKGLLTLDIAVREYPLEAAVLLGERSLVPEMLKAASHEPFWTDCKKAEFSDEACKNSEGEVRQLTAKWLTRLGDGTALEGYKKMVEAETDPALKQKLAAEMVRLEAAQECGQNHDCWVGKLKTAPAANGPAEAAEQAARVRDKAAFELAYLMNPLSNAPLLDAVQDSDPEVRFAVGFALLRLLPPLGAAEVEKVVAADRGKSSFARVNEFLKRVAVKMQRNY